MSRTTAESRQDELGIECDPRPIVALPAEGLPGLAIGGLSVIAAIALFLVIDGRRRDNADQATRSSKDNGALIASPPPLQAPPAYPEEVRYVIVDQPLRPSLQTAPVRLHPAAPVAHPEARAPQIASRPREWPQPEVAAPSYLPPLAPPVSAQGDEPALVIDGGVPVVRPRGPEASGQAKPDARPSESAFSPVKPRQIVDRTMVVAAGTLISAALETPIDTARPGMVRAITSRDTRGFDGRRVLVPRGSRLIGDYQADVRSGQNRVLVTWTMLVLPDGTQIELKSPAADSLGGAGIPGQVHSYFLARFASALLQSAMMIGTNLAIRSAGDGSIIVAVPAGQAGSMLGQELLPSDGYKPKITVKPGAAIKVFVARDLDFTESSNPAASGDR